MDAFELYNAAGKPVGIWACGKCRKLGLGDALRNTQESAEKCCRPQLCECGAEVAQHRTACRNCIDRKEAERTAKILADAAEVTDHEGYVYCDGYGRDGFANCLADLVEEIFDEAPDVRPEWAFPCQPRTLQLSLERAIDSLCDDGYEDMADRLDIEELSAAVDKFNAANAQVLQVWEPDYKRKIRIPAAQVEAC